MPIIPDRTLHLLDIENLLGDPEAPRIDFISMRAAYGNLRESDQVVLASSHFAALRCIWDWDGARFLIRSGKDGADLALLDVLANERVAERFDHVVIGSGDGIFTDAAVELRSRGVEVTVVAGRGGLSRRLACAATRVTLLGLPAPSDFGEAA